MIEYLEIKNYRSIKSITLESLQNANVLVGENGSAKSSILECLYIIDSIMKKDRIIEAFYTIANSRNIENVESDFYKSLFRDIDIENPIEFQIRLKTDIELISKKRILIHYIEQFDRIKKFTKIFPEFIGEKDAESMEKEFLLNVEKISGGIKPRISDALIIKLFEENDELTDVFMISINTDSQSKSEQTTCYIFDLKTGKVSLNYGPKEELSAIYFYPKKKQTMLPKTISAIIKKKKKNLIIKKLKTIEESLVDIALVDGNKIFCDTGKTSMISLDYLGEGFKRVLELIVFEESTGKLLFIDEVENGLYFKTQKFLFESLFKLAKSENIQMFMTTHSFETVQNIINTSIPKLGKAFYRLEKKEKGIVYLTVRYDEEEMRNAIDYKLEFR